MPKNSSIPIENSLVILKMDAIGDYILFRNYIKEIAKSKKYNNYNITLVGNELWKPIAERLDSKWINNFIWIKPTKFQKDFNYRKQKVAKLQVTEYELLFHPTFSRDFYAAESINSFIRAKFKITVEGDNLNTTKWQKRKSNKHYNTVLANPKSEIFEFSKNAILISDFLELSYFSKLSIDTTLLEDVQINSKNYILLFIGGGVEYRKWPKNNWIELINKILSINSYDIVLSGGPQDKEAGEAIKEVFKAEDRVLNTCGETSLLQLMSVIKNANWMISNETSAPHIAVAIGTPVIVISNANHYGRFTPYPTSISTQYFTIFTPEVEAEENDSILIEKFSKGSNLAIDKISSEAVFNKIIEKFQ